MKIQIEMPRSAGESGQQEVELPAAPRVGEVIKDANDRYYRVIVVIYQPWEPEGVPRIRVIVSDTYANSPEACMSGRETFGRMR